MNIEKFSISTLFFILIIFICISAFFSGSETGIMSINRYRLRHLVRKKNKAAIRVSKMLEKPEKVLGVVLIGNTFANIFAGSVATIIAVKLWGEYAIALATLILTVFILIFSEIAPKTLAANYPERIAFSSSIFLYGFLKILYPVVWLANLIVMLLFKLIRIPIKKQNMEHLSTEELSTLVKEAGSKIPHQHQAMLLGILNLEKLTVDEVMVPRKDIVGIDLDEDWQAISYRITHSSYTRLPVYEEDINRVKGILHLRDALDLMQKGQLNKNTLIGLMRDAYFVPEGAPLHSQLLNFRVAKQRLGLVVDEYGEVIGLVTLEDILEEIVGEFTTNITGIQQPIEISKDGSYLVSGSVNIRDLNRMMNWHFESQGPKTLSGLIIEYLEMIPQAGICLRLSEYRLEIIKVKGNKVELVKVYPQDKNL